MENYEYPELLEMFYRIQKRNSLNFQKRNFIDVHFGNKVIKDFPIQDILFLPRHLSELIFQQSENIKTVKFDFQEHNELIFNYFNDHHYNELFKYREETIRIWHIFNKDKLWGYNESISGIEKCFERLEQKWENGIDNYDNEIFFVNNNFEQILERKEEKFIKQIPFEVYNLIVQQLPEKRKLDWIKNIIPEGKEDIIKSRRFEAIGKLDMDKLNTEEMNNLLEIINKERGKMEWVGKICQCLQQKINVITEKIEQEKIESEKNNDLLIKLKEKEEAIKIENSKSEELLKKRDLLFEQFEKEKRVDVIKYFNNLGGSLSNYITATASSKLTNQPDLVFNDDSHDYFSTNDKQNSWIQFTLKQNKLILKEYSLRTHYSNLNGHIRGWKLEGSNDNNRWVLLSTFSSDTEFDNFGAEHSYKVDNSTPFKHFRLTQTRSNTMDCNNLRLTRFRLIGVIEPN